MSSILRALKRIEKEAPPADESHPWPRPIDSKKAVKARVKRRWMVNKLVSGLIVFLVVLVAGWIAFSQRHRIIDALLSVHSSEDNRQISTAPVKKKPAHQQKIKPRAANAIKPVQRNAPASGIQTGKTIAKSRPPSPDTLKSRPNIAVQKNVTRPRTIKNPTPADRKIPLKNTIKRSQAVQPSVSQRAPAGAPTEQRSSSAQKPAKVSGGQDAGFDALRVINDSILKLQAIAWAEETARRMAVINDHIVREGGTVDGYSITKIRRDDVIVNDGSTSWRLEFSLKQ